MRSLVVSTRVGSAVTKFKPSKSLRSAPWSILTAPAPSVRLGLEQYCPNLIVHLQLPRQTPWRRHLWRLLRQHSLVAKNALSSVSLPIWNPAGAGPLLCAESDILASSTLGRHQAQKGWESSAWRTRAHGA